MRVLRRRWKVTHKELVEVAYKWVLKRGSCGVAFKELKTANIEIPDVIGFGSGFSAVIECKVSRSDFLQDKKKPHRAQGMGTFKYFCCPEGLIKAEELPAKWGLIYVANDKEYKLLVNPKLGTNKVDVYDASKDYYIQYYPNAFERDIIAENKLMYSALRRLFIKGYVKHIYDQDYDGSRNVDVLIENNNPAK